MLPLPYIYLYLRCHHSFEQQLSSCLWYLPIGLCLRHLSAFPATLLQYSEYDPNCIHSFPPLHNFCPGILKPLSLTTFHIQG